MLVARVVLRIQAGQVAPALDDLRNALANVPETPQFEFRLSWAQHTDGNIQEARDALAMSVQCGLKFENDSSFVRS